MIDDLDGWLQQIGLGEYAAVFANNGVDLEALRLLTEQDLHDLGVLLGHRRKLLKAIAELRDAQTAASPGDSAKSLPQEPISTQGERRQLTVMFCDLVGSTALSEKLDPEELRALLHDYRTRCGDVISRYEGFVARYVGDGILTYFGWPKAHEEDAERALRAALEIVQAVKGASSAEPLSVRIGIATGPVVVGEQAGVGDQSKLAIGSTPNLAARLQGLAAADQIVIASSTRRLVGNSFDLADLGEHDLKGIAEPVHAWRVLAVSAAASRFEAAHGEAGLTPLVGREQEIDLLLERWAVAQGGEGQVVLLSGEPGIGKSRTLSTLRERLEAQGAQAMRFQCSPYHVNSAFYPSVDYFERTLKFTREEMLESKLDKLEALIVGQYGLPLRDVRFLASMLSMPHEQRYGMLTFTPQKYKDETIRVLLDVIALVARKQPTVMLFEDAHWADPTSLEVLDLLIDAVVAIPLLVVLTHRQEFQPKWGSHGHVTALSLSKLTRAQSGAIVSKLSSAKALPAGLLDQILRKTDGVPLYVEELTKSILESGELKDAGDHFDYAGAARTVTIPATLRDSLTARLDRSPAAKEIAQIGAAIGREFSYELIAAVAPHTQTDLDSALNQLTESGLAFRRGAPPEATYTFKHALVQDAAYDSLLKSRRQELHARIARVIEERFASLKTTEPEALAHHLTAAGLAQDAIPLWRTAGELALKRMGLTEAISHLDKGLELIATLPRSSARDASELRLRTLLGTAWQALKGWAAQEVWTSLHPAIALAQSLERNEALLPILFGLWVNVLTQGRVAESHDWAKQILATGASNSDPDMLMYGHLAALGTNLFLGQLVTSREHFNHVLALYDENKHRYLADIFNHDPRTMASVYATHVIWMLGYPDEAARLSDAKDAHACQRGHPFDRSWALCWGAGVFDYRCEPDTLLEHAQAAERLGREHSMPFVWSCLAPLHYGAALIRKGNFAEGLALLKPALAIFEANGCRVTSPFHECHLAEATACLGDLDGAMNIVEATIAQVEHPGREERVHYAEILRLKGWILSLKGDSRGAEQNYLASLDWARRQQAKSWELRTSTSLARLWQEQHKRKEAYDLLRPVYRWFTEGFDTNDLKTAKSLLEELESQQRQ